MAATGLWRQVGSAMIEGTEDVSLGGDEPWFNKSEIGRGRSPKQARRDPDI